MRQLKGWKFDEIEDKSSSTEKRIPYLSPTFVLTSGVKSDLIITTLGIISC